MLDKSKITVLHSAHIWLPQTQTWMYNQLYYLPEGVENHVICEDIANLDQFNVPHIHNLNQTTTLSYPQKKRIQELKLIQRPSQFFINLVKENGYQLLHSHFGNEGWINAKAAHTANLKHIVTFYGLDLNYHPRPETLWRKAYRAFWRRRYRQMFKLVDCVLCEGPHMAQCVVDLGCPPAKVNVHHLGIDLAKLPFKPRTWQPGETLRVLIAASFREKKGIPHALEVLGRLQSDIPLEITIIGDASPIGRSQLEKQKILNVLQKHNLLPKTRLLGYQPYAVFFKEAYQHHIFLSPSITASDGDTEGGAPVSIIEMVASGMPVISTTHCDIPEVVQYGDINLLAPEGDIDQLLENLQWLLNHHHTWPALLKTGRQHIETEFDVIKQGQRLKKMYESVLKNTMVE